MGDVIQFSLRGRPAVVRLRDGGGAEILFFTGVRYQRTSETAATRTGGDRPSSEGGLGGKRKRKRG